MNWIGLVIYGEVGRILADTGATIQYTFKPWIHRSKNHHQFDDLIDESKSDAWILYRSSIKVQEYFQNNAIPSILFGNAHKGINLPALTIDYSAALHHCLASLIRLKHDPKNILLVIPGTKLAGNLQLRETFTEILGPAASRQIISYQESTNNTSQVMQSPLLSTPRPTAIITLRVRAAVKIHGLLSNQYRLSIPQNISLICLEDAPLMEHLVPRISRYRVENKNVTNFVTSALSQLLSSGIGKPWGHRPLLPEFIKGETISAPPVRKR
ncbi:MAG: substrate-binding domain-containing protein [Akkermansiaceae bacterium]|nr:substrate-binding domain-containing protein [Akkermansiaceae bacterium]